MKTENNTDLDNSLRVVSETLRMRWENVHGHNLLETQKERSEARALIEKKKKQRTLCFIIVAVVMVPSAPPLGLFIASLTFSLYMTSVGILVPLLLFAILWFLVDLYLGKKIEAAENTVAKCDGILHAFVRSVKSLDQVVCGYSNWDIVSEVTVPEKLIYLAYRVLEAKMKFESNRTNAEVSEVTVISAGKWIEHCETVFTKAWGTATMDFAMELDKRDIFRQGAAKLEKEKAQKRA